MTNRELRTEEPRFPTQWSTLLLYLCHCNFRDLLILLAYPNSRLTGQETEAFSRLETPLPQLPHLPRMVNLPVNAGCSSIPPIQSLQHGQDLDVALRSGDVVPLEWCFLAYSTHKAQILSDLAWWIPFIPALGRQKQED